MAKIIIAEAVSIKVFHNLAGDSKIATIGYPMMLYCDGSFMLGGMVYLDGIVSTGDAPVKIVQGGV